MTILIILSILFALFAVGIGAFAGLVVRNYARFRYDAANALAVKNIEAGTAFDNKYYPATVLVKSKWGQNKESIVTDFSAYEDKKIVYIEINSVEPRPQLKDIFDEEPTPEMEERFNETMGKIRVLKNCEVFQPTRGIWLWRPQ